MNLSTLFKLFFSPTQGWQSLVSKHPPVHRLFLLHVVPFALIPPLMIYMAGNKGQILFLDLLPASKLLIVAIAFFLIQLIAVPLMASVIKQLCEVVEAHPTYIQAFTLAAVAPTPLWLMPVFLLMPNMLVMLVVTSLAMMASAGFIYYGIPETLEVREEGHRNLLFGAILTAGLVAWGFLMVTTLVVWGSVQNLHLA